MLSDQDRAEIFVAAARSYIGVPWVHQGRSERGLDCIGLVVLAAHQCGIDAPMDVTYGRFQDYRQAKTYLERFCVRAGSALPGDIVLYKNAQNLHVAIVSRIDDNHRPVKVVHAHGAVKKVVESGLSFPPLMLWRIVWP